MADDVALFTTALGSIDRAAGDTERAQERFEEALAMQRELGDDVRTAFTLASLAAGAIEHESFDEAVTLLNQSVQLLRDVGDGNSLAIVLAARAYVSSVLGAAADWREPLQIALDSEAWPAAAWALLVAAALAAHDAPDAAARWLAAGEAGYRDFAVSWDATELRVRAQAEALVRAAGGGSALAAERGNPTELGAAVREALDFGHSPE
jgi:tetratricopeptide (TPR) repeat protein